MLANPCQYLPSNMVRLRTQVQLHHAAALIRTGDIPQGLRLAADLLEDLPVVEHNDLVPAVARQVIDAAPAGERGRPAYRADRAHHRITCSNMVTYSHHDGESSTHVVPALVNLYGVVYAEPPYLEGPDEIDRFRAGIKEESTRAGFALVTAYDGEQLVGAAYGWTMSAGSWWSRADRDAPSEIRDAAKFAIKEWVVHPQRRAEGIGAELIGRLLRDRQERWATLASDPRSAARSMYERAGWRQVARSELPWGITMDLLVLEIAGS